MPLKDFIRNLISIELAYVNTNHPDFFGGGQTALMLLEKLKNQNQAQQQPVQSLPQNLPKAPVKGGQQPPIAQQQVSISFRVQSVSACGYFLCACATPFPPFSLSSIHFGPNC